MNGVGDNDMVSETKRDWEGLKRKISSGKSLEQSCEETGIPVSEAAQWIEEQKPGVNADDFVLRAMSFSAIQKGFEVLTQIAQEGPRVDVRGGEGGEYTNQTDLEAAKILVNSGLTLRKILATGAARRLTATRKDADGSTTQFDLFDLQAPWTFPET